MNKAYHLHARISENAAAHSQDVLATKALLQQHGLYKTPDWGVSAYPDRALFEAIRAFQKSQGLRVDGIMKPQGETEAAMQAASVKNQTDAQRIQALGRNGDTLLAHITPEEAQLLDTITDGGSINPATGLMEFHHIGGSNYTRERRAEADNRRDSAERATSGNQKSGDWDSDRGRTLGYNDFNPGGAFGGNNRNGTNKTGRALSVHNRAVIKQKALQREKEQQAALKAKNAAEAQRQQTEAERARATAAAMTAPQTTTAMQAPPRKPSSPFDLNANPNRLTTLTNQDTPEQAPTPTTTPTAPETTEGVDPAWAPTATPATPAQQTENIKNVAINSANTADEFSGMSSTGAPSPIKERVFTQKQLDAAAHANKVKALGRRKVNDYLDAMKAHKASDKNAPQKTAAEVRKSVWEQVGKKADAAAKKVADITKMNAARLGVPNLPDVVASDPEAQAALINALSFRFQTKIEQRKTLKAIVELSNKYPQYPGFGKSGAFGELALSVTDRAKTPSQMTDEELRASIKDAKWVKNSLEVISLFSPSTLVSISSDFTADAFDNALKKMQLEINARKEE